MAQQVSSFDWKPCDDRTPVPGCVASVACLVSELTTIINIATTMFRDVLVPVNYVLVDNYNNAQTQVIAMGPVTYTVPAYKRSVFRVPPTAKVITMTLNTDCTLVLSNVPDYLVAEADEVAIQQAANQFVSYPWITLTAGRALNETTDQNKNILLSAASAQTYTLGDVTALPNGYFNPMIRNAGTGRWSLTPNSGQFINSDWSNANPLQLSQNDQVTLSGDGNQWHASGSISFTSAQQTITALGNLTVAHGLVRAPMPFECEAWLECVAANIGYSIGDKVKMPANSDDGTRQTWSIVPDATNLYLVYNTATTDMINKTTGARAVITTANWRLVLKARIFL